MKVPDPRGVGVWPKRLPELTEAQSRVRDAFAARWLEVVPRYSSIERFNQSYPLVSPPCGRTLEIGAGLGEHLRYENLEQQEYYAVELREELAAVTRERFPSVTTIAADCQERLPFGDAFFDRVVAVHVLEHLPDLPRALDEIRRVLAADGRLFAVIPCEGGLAYWLARRLSAQRLFEKEFGMDYRWFIRSEHVNVPWEILTELRKRFRLVGSQYFPFRLPSTMINLAIGLTLEPLSDRFATGGDTVTTKPSQTAKSVEKNTSFFADNPSYARNIVRLQTYRNIRSEVNEAIRGKRKLLDIGNGGVFDYDTRLVGEIVGVDLFLDGTATGDLPENVTLRHGDALELPEPDASYDGVLIVSVLHHLVSTDVAGTIENIRRAIREAHRVLEPGGQLIVMESCISRWAYAIERRLFGALSTFADTRLMAHPATLQLPPAAIAGLLRERFADVQVRPIPVGRLILQFGHRWPTVLTPARPYLFVAG